MRPRKYSGGQREKASTYNFESAADIPVYPGTSFFTVPSSSMSPSKATRPHAKLSAADDGDPRPTPPVEPALEDCCGSGCAPCIFDIYEQARERYLHELEAWNARQALRSDAGKRGRRRP